MKTYKIYAKNETTKRSKMIKEFNLINEAFDYAVSQNKTDMENIYSIGYVKNPTR
jgi:hypothetical protein